MSTPRWIVKGRCIYKTQICKNYLNGNCIREDCMFAHDKAEKIPKNHDCKKYHPELLEDLEDLEDSENLEDSNNSEDQNSNFIDQLKDCILGQRTIIDKHIKENQSLQEAIKYMSDMKSENETLKSIVRLLQKKQENHNKSMSELLDKYNEALGIMSAQTARITEIEGVNNKLVSNYNSAMELIHLYQTQKS